MWEAVGVRGGVCGWGDERCVGNVGVQGECVMGAEGGSGGQ